MLEIASVCFSLSFSIMFFEFFYVYFLGLNFEVGLYKEECNGVSVVTSFCYYLHDKAV
ncbi:hypothetical protein Lalb_Chr09g0333171 [Lupinus albus]|uniref:Uncharacterized protein n=1 Tax=Lupinus albus TaxID=3870 RepID=A0A6A4Q266_LUPAL|nr:hypothetical protein Lalb_Chr09g0333171 [Lupinus albus]